MKKYEFSASFLKKSFAFSQIHVILHNITQTYGVMVAQVILVHFVEVRILVGLPFFCPVRNPCKKQLLTLANFDLPVRSFSFCCGVFALAKTGLLTYWRLPCASRPCGLRCSRSFGLRPPSNPCRSAIFFAPFVILAKSNS